MEVAVGKGVIYEFGGFVLDQNERTLAVDDVPIHLPAKEFDTLLYLIENNGRALTKEEIMSAIWQDTFVEEANLAKQISKLRKVLNNGQTELIQTIPKHGYRFTVSDLRRREPRAREQRPSERVDRAPFPGRRRAVALGVLTLAIAVSLFLYFSRSVAAPLSEKDTILLSDFENTSGDAVFDGTLKQALAIQLEQSPFLNIFSDQRVRETLRFMDRSPDERVTKDLAGEICERQGLKAYLLGSISSHGSHFVITLEAVNTQTGDVIARQQVEAESKEQVISALGGASTKLREKLGESLSSIEKYDAPIQEVTTSSLGALKAYSMGRKLSDKVKMDEAIPFYKRAVEIDPNFALAYAALSERYILTGQRELGNQAGQKAFDMRERGSERERLSITATYYKFTGELEKAIEANEMLTRIYPREGEFWNELGWVYLEIGRAEKALEAFREATRLYPNPYSYYGFGLAFTRLNRFEEAIQIFEQALTQNDHPFFHSSLYYIAFVNEDAAGMKQQTDWASARPDQLQLIWQGNTEAFSGKLRKAREFYIRAIDIEQLDNKEYANRQLAAGDAAWIAFREAVSGNCQYVKEDTAKSLAIMREDGAKWKSAVALALCGETTSARSLTDELEKHIPKDSINRATWLSLARAAIEIRGGSPKVALDLLEESKAYVGAGYEHPAPVILLWAEYFRGVAYLNQKEAAKAAAEFQKILDHRGMIPIGIHYPLAHLGMARSAVLSGDPVKARKYYQIFFLLWKDADRELPVFRQAESEFAKLN